MYIRIHICQFSQTECETHAFLSHLTQFIPEWGILCVSKLIKTEKTEAFYSSKRCKCILHLSHDKCLLTQIYLYICICIYVNTIKQRKARNQEIHQVMR